MSCMFAKRSGAVFIFFSGVIVNFCQPPGVDLFLERVGYAVFFDYHRHRLTIALPIFEIIIQTKVCRSCLGWSHNNLHKPRFVLVMTRRSTGWCSLGQHGYGQPPNGLLFFIVAVNKAQGRPPKKGSFVLQFLINGRQVLTSIVQSYQSLRCSARWQNDAHFVPSLMVWPKYHPFSRPISVSLDVVESSFVLFVDNVFEHRAQGSSGISCGIGVSSWSSSCFTGFFQQGWYGNFCCLHPNNSASSFWLGTIAVCTPGCHRQDDGWVQWIAAAHACGGFYHKTSFIFFVVEHPRAPAGSIFAGC